MIIEHGTFILFVFSINGSMGRESRTFYSRLSDLLSKKRDLPKSITMSWIRTKNTLFPEKCAEGSRV